MIVTIDGPAGSGKSTAARGLAERLGFEFLDTGAMYRAVALEALRVGVDLVDRDSLSQIARKVRIDALGSTVHLDGRDVTTEIRTPEVTAAASRVAAVPEVREAMVVLQRQAAANRDIVTEGRDQGTVVFPQAECKFYLTANSEERVRRRQQELEQQGKTVAFEDLRAQIRERDTRDKEREAAPLRQANDALRIDTSAMSPEHVVSVLEAIVRERRVRPETADSTEDHSTE